MIEIGTRINDWTYLGPSKTGRKRYGTFKCACGFEKDVFVSSVTTGTSKSCGECLRHKFNLSKMDYETIYSARQRAIDRCYNPNNPSYTHYGPRGITVCEEWRISSEAFIKWAVENGWKRGLSLDRINNDGNYEPSNCRWATLKQQANNTSKNVYITHNGIRRTMTQWCEAVGIPPYVARNRWHRGVRDFYELFSPESRRSPGVMLYNQL